MTLSPTQREVLEKMRDGYHIFLLSSGWYFFVEGDYQRVETEMIDQLTDLDLIEYTDEMYIITPLGIEALGGEQ
ncbi:hypothetical protein KA005_53205 [bacterium]|nr:hypothetical protein [bacterium]